MNGIDAVILYLENGHRPMAELHHIDGSVKIIHWDNDERKEHFDPYFTAYVKFEDKRFVKEPERFTYNVGFSSREGYAAGLFAATEEEADAIYRFCNKNKWLHVTREGSCSGTGWIDLTSKKPLEVVVDRKLELSQLYAKLKMECKSENAEKLKEIEKEYFDLLDEDQKLAIILHNKFCKLISDCYWSYETTDSAIHDFTGYEHQQYLEQAKKMLKQQPYNVVIGIVDLL